MKNRTKFLFLYLSIVSFLPLVGQETIKYKLEEVATIEVSTRMELQDEAYQQAAESYYEQYNYVPVSGRAVFQQLGVNQKKQDALALYVRIIHETKRGAYGDFPRLGVDPEISVQEIQEIDEAMKDQMMSPQPMGIKVTKWLGTNIVELNGQYALHTAYERQMKTNPVVRVDRYSFFNNDRLQVLTLSYRLSETGRWKSTLESALDSYRIIR